MKNVFNTDGRAIPITAADCTSSCTGASTKLPQHQCTAWVLFYDALGGDSWNVTDANSPKYGQPVCANSRTDPCSCYNWVDSPPTSICNDAGTAVTRM
jgi:hypothetical protein